MNRMEEFNALVAELAELPPETAGTVNRAIARRNRKRYLFQPMTAVAALFLCFVALVNLVPGVAYACGNIPILDKLAEAVSFSPSLSKAVEHDYVQPVDRTQTANGITATIESLIVDQKQVIVYYTLDSGVYDHLTASVGASLMDGTPAQATVVSNMPYVENGTLQSATVNFVDGASVPDRLRVTLYIASLNDRGDLTAADVFNPEFVLDLEPQFTGQGRAMNLCQGLDLGGQRFTLTGLECYPTHLRVNLRADPSNTATLEHLAFYLELPDGTRLTSGSAGGITATGSTEDEHGLSLYAESSYFYNADRVKLVVTGATFLDKSAKNVRVDLTTGDHDPLPFNARIDSIERTETGWQLEIIAPEALGIHGGVFTWEYYAPDGTADTSGHMGYTGDWPEKGYGTQLLYVDAYSYNEVFLKPTRTAEWLPDVPLTVELPTK